jgi:DNA invertase Pin-like site-specific DNA recombinase
VVAVPVRAGIYARISSDREGEGLGVARQLEDCQRLAEARGWTVVERYVDQDVSAYTGRLRPEYGRLRTDIEGRAIDALAIYRADRLHRQPRELEAFIDLCEAVGLTNVASVSGDLDLTTHEGQLVARITGAVAKNESDVKSQRIRRQKEQAAEQGRVAGGGTRAYGWEADKRTVRLDEAEIVRECARRFLAGESTRSICADLNKRGVLTATGKKWAPQTMRRMLANPRMSGQCVYKGEIVSDAVWPALISREDGEQIRAKLADPNRRTNKSARRYLLVRLLKCSHCGEYLVSRPRGDGTRRYGCAKGPGFSGCGKTFINAEPLEQFVAAACLSRLDSRELAAAVRAQSDQPEAERWQQEADTVQAKLDELALAWSADEITRAEWRVARTALEQRLTAARRQLGKITHTTVLDGLVGNADDVRASWDSLDLTRQHAILEAILDHVEVGPARRGYNAPLDESRLRAVFRV